jgi:hypothetical protein
MEWLRREVRIEVIGSRRKESFRIVSITFSNVHILCRGTNRKVKPISQQLAGMVRKNGRPVSRTIAEDGSRMTLMLRRAGESIFTRKEKL